jgi:hypothetical protein
VTPFSALDEQLYLQTYVRAVRQPSRTPQLLRAIVVAAISSLEPLATRLAVLALHHSKPGQYASLADDALDAAARNLFRNGGPAKWREAFVALGITAFPQVADWNRLEALWQDRNVIVHRGSVVDEKHSVASGKMVGTVLEYDAIEARSVIDEIGAARFGIACAVWDFLSPTSNGTRLAEAVTPFVVESLEHRRWHQAEGLGRVQEALASDAEALAVARINQGIAIDHRLGPDAIYDEVQEFDVSALPSRFAMARSVLLGNLDEAFGQLHVGVDTGETTLEHLDTLPLFWRLRGDERFRELVHIAGQRQS